MAETTYSDWVVLSARTNPIPLEDEPQEFAVEAKTETSITLKWGASERGDETNYEIERETQGEFKPLAEIAAGGELKFQDVNLQPDTQYNYRIRSVKK